MAILEQDFDKDIVKMQESFARLKREYDLFFAGNRKDPPYRESKDLDTLVKKWRNANVTRLAVQFRLQSFLSSYTLQTEMWNKWMRQKEEGLARDPRLVAAVRKGREVLRELDKGITEPEREVVDLGVAPAPELPPAQEPKRRAAELPPELPVIPAKAESKSNGAARKLFDQFIKAKMDQGEIPDVDFAAFEKKLVKQKKEIAQKYQDHEVVFSVVAKDGKVSLKAKVVKRKEPGD